MSTPTVRITGLTELVRELKGPAFRDVNRELRRHSRTIASDLVAPITTAVAASGAPQAAAMSGTVRVHSDRVPVVVVGKTNPRFRSGFTRRGAAASSKQRRGSLAHGVVYGPAGGKRSTPAAENYYRIGRDATGGALGRALADNGPIFEQACNIYLRVYLATLRAHGFDITTLRGVM